MAEIPETTPALPNALGAGTSTPPDPAEAERLKATLPGGANFDVDNASEPDYKEHIKRLKRRKEVADQTIMPATPLVAVPGSTVAAPAPSTFSAPSAPLVAKHSEVTGLTVEMPEKLWDVLSDEDKDKHSTQVEKPAPLPTE